MTIYINSSGRKEERNKGCTVRTENQSGSGAQSLNLELGTRDKIFIYICFHWLLCFQLGRASAQTTSLHPKSAQKLYI